MPADRDSSAESVHEIVRGCLAGDARAITLFVERFEQRIFALCYRMLGQREDAEDVAQESLLRALRSLHHWDNRRQLQPWLLAIAGNRCRTLLATRSRRLKSTEDVRYIADPAPPPEQHRHMAEELHLALGQLRAEYRQAFVLFHEQEMSYQEIGAALNCPVGTAKTWVHRARRELIAQLRARHAVPENYGVLRRV